MGGEPSPVLVTVFAPNVSPFSFIPQLDAQKAGKCDHGERLLARRAIDDDETIFGQQVICRAWAIEVPAVERLVPLRLRSGETSSPEQPTKARWNSKMVFANTTKSRSAPDVWIIASISRRRSSGNRWK